MPTGRTVSMCPAGQWWDAVRVPRRIALDVLGLLGTDTGAVIEDPLSGQLYWLVPPGMADTWRFRPGAQVRVLGQAMHLAVPGPQRTAGPHWRIPPTPSRCLTEPEALQAALATAVMDALGPRPERAL